jgi:hypothetical protein
MYAAHSSRRQGPDRRQCGHVLGLWLHVPTYVDDPERVHNPGELCLPRLLHYTWLPARSASDTCIRVCRLASQLRVTGLAGEPACLVPQPVRQQGQLLISCSCLRRFTTTTASALREPSFRNLRAWTTCATGHALQTAADGPRCAPRQRALFKVSRKWVSTRARHASETSGDASSKLAPEGSDGTCSSII